MNRYKLNKAGINVNEGLKRFSNNKPLYEKYLFRFPEDDNYQQMLAAIEAADVNEAFLKAHALKGLTGNLSIDELYQNLLPLVEELRAGSMEKTAEYLPVIRESYERAMEEIKREREPAEEM